MYENPSHELRLTLKQNTKLKVLCLSVSEAKALDFGFHTAYLRIGSRMALMRISDAVPDVTLICTSHFPPTVGSVLEPWYDNILRFL